MINELLNEYILDSENPEKNYKLAREYERLGQSAAAISFFLRASERTTDKLLSYDCTLRIGNCFDKQKNRNFTVKSMYRCAIMIMPERPEAYYLLAKYLNWEGNHSEAYLFCQLEKHNRSQINKYLDVGFRGRWGLLHEEAISAWWYGKSKETRKLFLQLFHDHWDEMDEYHKNSVLVNMKERDIKPEIDVKENNLLDKEVKTLTKNDTKQKIIEKYEEYDKLFGEVSWGWCSLNKAGCIIDYIDDICSRVENPTCVEIGVFAGKSALPAALELKRHNKGKLYAIDPWSNEEASKGYEYIPEAHQYWKQIDLQSIYNFFLSMLKDNQVEEHVNVIRMPSDDAPVIDNIDYLYIDGQHTDQSHRDVMKYATKVKLDGYCIADDIEWGNVKEVPVMLESLGFQKIHAVDTAFVYKRTRIINLIDSQGPFKININMAKRGFIVDNFYADPYAVRKFAQSQKYFDGGLGRGFIGRRSENQFLFPGIKEAFESIMGKKVTKWEEYGMNGRFQLNIGGEPLVYHCDSQKFAAMIYLTPDAPPSCGTSTFMHKETRVHHNSDPNINKVFYGIKTTMDRTPYENVDKFGNIFNRLVIFDAGCIHAASEYFGADMEDGRLWHMFFFDAE